MTKKVIRNFGWRNGNLGLRKVILKLYPTSYQENTNLRYGNKKTLYKLSVNELHAMYYYL